ncbi:MAG: hypothetical protein HQM08_09200 [Candidatus Riflebacteria bacterium]|nr:hypothetical protein [Candidatus Riflebacteria bacterium]
MSKFSHSNERLMDCENNSKIINGRNVLPIALTLAFLALSSYNPIHPLPFHFCTWTFFITLLTIYLVFRGGLFSICTTILSTMIFWESFPFLINPAWYLGKIFHLIASAILFLFKLTPGIQSESFAFMGNMIALDPAKSASLAILVFIFFRFSISLVELGLKSAIIGNFCSIPFFLLFGSFRWIIVAVLLSHLNLNLVEWGLSLFSGPGLGISLLPLLFMPEIYETQATKKYFSSPFIIWILTLPLLLIVQELPLFTTPVKTPNVLIDEVHSNWEPAVIDSQKLENPILAENNYFSFTKFLARFSTVSIIAAKEKKNISFAPSSLKVIYSSKTAAYDNLQRYDILILKCPTETLGEENIKKVLSFVENGGTLWLIGEHTNVFMTGKYINEILKRANAEICWDGICDQVGQWLITFGLFHSSTPFSPAKSPYMWATGASIKGDLDLIPLAVSAPNTFSDSWNPFNSYFFGNLSPDLSYKYGPFVLSAMKFFGKGKIFIHGDSTNFNESMLSTPGKYEFISRLIKNFQLDKFWFIAILILNFFFGILSLRALGDLLRSSKNFLAILMIMLYSLFPLGFVDYSFSKNLSFSKHPGGTSDLFPSPAILVDSSLKPSLGTNYGNQTDVASSSSLCPLLVQLQNRDFFLKTAVEPLKNYQLGHFQSVIISEPTALVDSPTLECLKNYVLEGGNLLLVFRKSPGGSGRQIALTAGLYESINSRNLEGFPDLLSPHSYSILTSFSLPLTANPVGKGCVYIIERWSEYQLSMKDNSQISQKLLKDFARKKQ